MSTTHGSVTFNEISETHSTWVIKYCSPTFNNPLFLIWYTDTDKNSTDKLLTYKNGKIFATDSLNDLKSKLRSENKDLIWFDNLNIWLENSNNLAAVEYCTYDLISLTNELDAGNMNDTLLGDFIDFINLYRDFVNQHPNNLHLRVYSHSNALKKIWNYYYDFTFWPLYGKPDEAQHSKKPKLGISSKKIASLLKELQRTFEENLQLN